MSPPKEQIQFVNPRSRIGVIIPLFNDVRVAHSIASVTRHDPHGLTRIYLIDGGSEYHIQSLAQQHLRPHDYFKSEIDRGIFDALNKGLDVMQEDIVAWIGSDDFFTSAVEFDAVVTSFDAEDIDCYVYDLVFTNGTKVQRITTAAAPTPANMRRGRHVQHFSSFWRKSKIGNTRFDLRFPIASDQDFFCKMSFLETTKAKLDHKVATVARLGGNSSKDWKRIAVANVEVYRIFRQYMSAVTAAVATTWKLMRKLRTYVFPPDYAIVDEMTDLIVRL